MILVLCVLFIAAIGIWREYDVFHLRKENAILRNRLHKSQKHLRFERERRSRTVRDNEKACRKLSLIGRILDNDEEDEEEESYPTSEATSSCSCSISSSTGS